MGELLSADMTKFSMTPCGWQQWRQVDNKDQSAQDIQEIMQHIRVPITYGTYSSNITLHTAPCAVSSTVSWTRHYIRLSAYAYVVHKSNWHNQLEHLLWYPILKLRYPAVVHQRWPPATTLSTHLPHTTCCGTPAVAGRRARATRAAPSAEQHITYIH